MAKVTSGPRHRPMVPVEAVGQPRRRAGRAARALSLVAVLPLAAGCGLWENDDQTPTGNVVELDGFTFEAGNVDWDAGPEARTVNEFNGNPDPGNRFIFVTITATRTGSTSASLGSYGAAVYQTEEDEPWPANSYTSCVVTPQPWNQGTEMQPGDAQDGIFCFEIGEEPVSVGEISIRISHQIADGGAVRAIVNEGG